MTMNMNYITVKFNLFYEGYIERAAFYYYHLHQNSKMPKVMHANTRIHIRVITTNLRIPYQIYSLNDCAKNISNLRNAIIVLKV